jgi:hypothetical protein
MSHAYEARAKKTHCLSATQVAPMGRREPMRVVEVEVVVGGGAELDDGGGGVMLEEGAELELEGWVGV